MADRLFAMSFRMLGDRQEAEDAVQQAFLELLRTASPPRHGPSLEAWLFTSVRYTCFDTQRASGRKPAVPMAAVPDRDDEDAMRQFLSTGSDGRPGAPCGAPDGG